MVKLLLNNIICSHQFHLLISIEQINKANDNLVWREYPNWLRSLLWE